MVCVTRLEGKVQDQMWTLECRVGWKGQIFAEELQQIKQNGWYRSDYGLCC